MPCFIYVPIPVVTCGCESWTVKKAERQRIDAFELQCWRRLLRVPWTARRSNQSILKEISPGCSLEGMMLKLKLQYSGHLMRRVGSLERTLMLGGIGGQEEKGTTEDEMAGWHHGLDGRESEWTPGGGDKQGGLAFCNSWGRKESDTTEWLNWTELNWTDCILDSLKPFEEIGNVTRLRKGPETIKRYFYAFLNSFVWFVCVRVKTFNSKFVRDVSLKFLFVLICLILI